jgi:hypothetical protein
MMTRLMPVQRMMLNLQQKLEPGHMAYLTKEQAYEELKKIYRSRFRLRCQDMEEMDFQKYDRRMEMGTQALVYLTDTILPS